MSTGLGTPTWTVIKTIATTPITSMLYYCNSLRCNIASKDILRRQCVQHCLASVVKRYPRFSNFVPLLKSVHWLPVQYLIISKLCTITYQITYSGEPSYLFSMILPKPCTRCKNELDSSLRYWRNRSFIIIIIIIIWQNISFMSSPVIIDSYFAFMCRSFSCIP